MVQTSGNKTGWSDVTLVYNDDGVGVAITSWFGLEVAKVLPPKMFFLIFNRPGVAGAVLQSPP